MKINNKLSQERLKEVLSYNQETGIFKRKISIPSVNKGAIAGSKHSGGYKCITIDYESYLCHRLAWLYVYGYLPENDVDHVNRVRGDNRISNLREVSRSCNLRNSSLSKSNTSGVTGVSYNKRDKRWLAEVRAEDKKIKLGYFVNFKDAVMARWNGEVKYKYTDCCTTSSAYGYLNERNLL